jgi:hypothetical protein
VNPLTGASLEPLATPRSAKSLPPRGFPDSTSRISCCEIAADGDVLNLCNYLTIAEEACDEV